jgi:RES domain-containing protein
VRLYRICRRAHRKLDGEGARLYGGCWNSPGRAVVYTSSTLSLAALEYLIHVDPEDVPSDLVAQTIEVPDDLVIDSTSSATLRPGWDRTPAPQLCKDIGDGWVTEGRACGLRVPSAAVREESNVLLSPRHADAGRVRVVAERVFSYDPRLLS